MHDHPDHASWSTTPGFAKLLILTQTLLIVFFSFWFYQEYLNNQYFRAYLDTSLQGAGLPLLAITATLLVTTTLVGLFRRARRTREFHLLPETKPEAQPVLGLIDNHTEAHLIDMIRRTSPEMASSKPAELPTLKQREEQEPRATTQSKLA